MSMIRSRANLGQAAEHTVLVHPPPAARRESLVAVDAFGNWANSGVVDRNGNGIPLGHPAGPPQEAGIRLWRQTESSRLALHRGPRARPLRHHRFIHVST